MKAKVWDPLCADESCAREVDDIVTDVEGNLDPDCEEYIIENLAEQYAEKDVDGTADGIYENGHDIVVLLDNGKRYVVTVTVEYDPVYDGTIKEQSG